MGYVIELLFAATEHSDKFFDFFAAVIEIVSRQCVFDACFEMVIEDNFFQTR